MGVASPLILVANPGSASRKYALFRGDHELAALHFEWENGRIVCTASGQGEPITSAVEAAALDDCVEQVVPRFREIGVLPGAADGSETSAEHAVNAIAAIGLRIVAPSSYFLQNHCLDADALHHLQQLENVAPLHIGIVRQEHALLHRALPGIKVYGISDSAFHVHKPDYAWNYGISLHDADTYDIKRFGYHGLSVSSAVRQLRASQQLATKMVVAHLGSGGSVSAVHGGESRDNTMGYSPLEGIVMATRSGSIDYSAVRALQIHTGMSNSQIEHYLTTQAGLLGLGGSNDIRELRKREQAGDDHARLALATAVYAIQKAIGQMTAALGGIDALVFTGTVGERSAVLRGRIMQRLQYLGFQLSAEANQACLAPQHTQVVSEPGQSKPIYIVHTDEAAEIALQTAALLDQ